MAKLKQAMLHLAAAAAAAVMACGCSDRAPQTNQDADKIAALEKRIVKLERDMARMRAEVHRQSPGSRPSAYGMQPSEQGEGRVSARESRHTPFNRRDRAQSRELTIEEAMRLEAEAKDGLKQLDERAESRKKEDMTKEERHRMHEERRRLHEQRRVAREALQKARAEKENNKESAAPALEHHAPVPALTSQP